MALRPCLAAVSLLFAAAAVPAQADVAKAAPRRVTVHCVDTDGKPVAGAEVHVFQWKPLPGDARTLVHDGPLHSGHSGTVAVDAAAPESFWTARWAYARIADRLVGAASTDPMERAPGDEMTIVLEPSRTLRGRVVTPPGTALEGVKVRVLRLSVDDGNTPSKKEFPRQGLTPELQRTLPDRFDCGAGPDGTFVLRDLPLAPSLVLAVTGPGLAETQWPDSPLADRRPPERLELAVPAEAVFAGVVAAPDGAPAAGARIELRLALRARPVQSGFVATTDERGRFRIGGLPGADFDLMVWSPAGVMRPVPTTIATSEQRNDVALRLEAGVEVAGLVVAADDGTPIAGARLVATANQRTFPRPETGRTTTGADGRFSLRLPAGATRLQVFAPRGFAAPRGPTDLEVTAADGTLRTLRLELTRRQ